MVHGTFSVSGFGSLAEAAKKQIRINGMKPLTDLFIIGIPPLDKIPESTVRRI